jgi:ribosome maturation factor RimP
MSRQLLTTKLETIAASVAEAAHLELVELELKGTGRNHLVRVYIDKPEGVTHEDCQQISDSLGEQIEAGNLIDGQYTLEVSSPGVERKLKKQRDFERFVGQKVKVHVKEPVDNKKLFEGTLTGFSEETATVETESGAVRIPYDQIDRANLKFEW